MHFERSLQRAIYRPWKDYYIDYGKLKNLLKDDGSDAGSSAAAHTQDEDDDWTDEDEGAFVEELVNVQLEKVHNFHSTTIQKLRERTSNCEAKLDPILVKDDSGDDAHTGKVTENAEKTLREVLKELDSITTEMNELERFSRINYTGFLKATKKHDRKRGHAYRVRPLMQVRLAALSFNKEDYSPLLFRLSTMYSFIRQHLDGSSDSTRPFSESYTYTEEFVSYRFWVHPENLLELRTVIMRRLPVLIYNPQTSKIAEAGQRDPTITSIYFDNPRFSLYNAKVDHDQAASSLRLRWYDQLSSNPEIFCEKKTVYPNDKSVEQRFTTKSKYVKPYLKGDYQMGKEIQKLKDRFGEDAPEVTRFQEPVEQIQKFIKSNDLQPVLRANYVRTAFQIPGDNRVRITLDTDLALIREDALDLERPCRDPDDWHRHDIDDNDMEYPFEKINKGEINRFPFALMEIRIKDDKQYEWISELMNSHLVKPSPKFSKFVHGVAQLFDDYVNTFPFWLSEVDTDIRRDPQQAFEEEQERKAKAAEDEFAVGSFLRKGSSPAFRPSTRSPIGSPASHPKSSLSKSQTPEKATAEMTRKASMTKEALKQENVVDEADSDDDGTRHDTHDSSGFKSIFHSFSRSKFALSRHPNRIKLPPGVYEPSFWIKNEGPVKVEAKVWLANQRTFIKWQHVSILLAAVSLALYNAAGIDNRVARTLGVVYTCIALFTALWGLGIYLHRCRLIEQRSGKDFDNIFGPIVVCIALVIALCINFGIKYHVFLQKRDSPSNSSETVVYKMGGEDL